MPNTFQLTIWEQGHASYEQIGHHRFKVPGSYMFRKLSGLRPLVFLLFYSALLSIIRYST